ncbi:hypothetical protein DB31_2540 [Hyalangium minutum]|uniref:Uncharacterized protein n=1 Tax=Hyalangium minutum TaxID=394096 RepID=A0A085W6V9_9BACT|nr:hypothetical protein DB31_2540 [Hyalangium minutum]
MRSERASVGHGDSWRRPERRTVGMAPRGGNPAGRDVR